MSNLSGRTILIAGGGTGGHIYPGVAIARRLQQVEPGTRIVFVGAVGGLECTIVPREGFELEVLPIGKLHRSAGLRAQLRTLLLLPLALWRALRLVLRERPRAILGVGGYASGPVVLIGALLRIRTLIWEPNAQPGLANRWLAPWVDEALVVFDEAAGALKAPRLTRVGIPVRSEISARPSEPLANRRPRILVTGASQGARAINRAVMSLAEQEPNWMSQFDVLHQTGRLDHTEMRDRGTRLGLPRYEVCEYLHDMANKLSWADLIICRAGASTVAEVCASERAAIFIPLPTAADDHQAKNAQSLVAKGAAEILPQAELSPQSLRAKIQALVDQPNRLLELGRRAGQLAVTDAADRIVERLGIGANERAGLSEQDRSERPST
jgi:UDP-N-acetylglucosamine--N-acetylmuramyl-(pentapeptide) pyrophosphoryl-undecaprenol N-acetylglucosamine transferase